MFYNIILLILPILFSFVNLQKALERVSASEEYFSYNMLGIKGKQVLLLLKFKPFFPIVDNSKMINIILLELWHIISITDLN